MSETSFAAPLPDREQNESCSLRPAFGPDGLIAAIAQEENSKKVLMLAWMNAEALALTLKTGKAVYWSRSRCCLWRKGEVSGNEQTIISIHVDCDQDALLLTVRQTGPACHTGRQTCFYRLAEHDGLKHDQ